MWIRSAGHWQPLGKNSVFDQALTWYIPRLHSPNPCSTFGSDHLFIDSLIDQQKINTLDILRNWHLMWIISPDIIIWRMGKCVKFALYVKTACLRTAPLHYHANSIAGISESQCLRYSMNTSRYWYIQTWLDEVIFPWNLNKLAGITITK